MGPACYTLDDLLRMGLRVRPEQVAVLEDPSPGRLLTVLPLTDPEHEAHCGGSCHGAGLYREGVPVLAPTIVTLGGPEGFYTPDELDNWWEGWERLPSVTASTDNNWYGMETLVVRRLWDCLPVTDTEAQQFEMRLDVAMHQHGYYAAQELAYYWVGGEAPDEEYLGISDHHLAGLTEAEAKALVDERSEAYFARLEEDMQRLYTLDQAALDETMALPPLLAKRWRDLRSISKRCWKVLGEAQTEIENREEWRFNPWA